MAKYRKTAVMTTQRDSIVSIGTSPIGDV